VDDLLRSHAELRAALRIAGRRIRQLQFGRGNDAVLAKLRETLQEARAVARRYGERERMSIVPGYDSAETLRPCGVCGLRKYWFDGEALLDLPCVSVRAGYYRRAERAGRTNLIHPLLRLRFTAARLVSFAESAM